MFSASVLSPHLTHVDLCIHPTSQPLSTTNLTHSLSVYQFRHLSISGCFGYNRQNLDCIPSLENVSISPSFPTTNQMDGRVYFHISIPNNLIYTQITLHPLFFTTSSRIGLYRVCFDRYIHVSIGWNLCTLSCYLYTIACRRVYCTKICQRAFIVAGDGNAPSESGLWDPIEDFLSPPCCATVSRRLFPAKKFLWWVCKS